MLQGSGGNPIDRRFFDRSALEVAPGLLGRILVREDWRDDGTCLRRSGSIVETEAYMQDDPAFHAWGIVDPPTGLVRPSGRGYDLFAAPGTAYVYLCYGIHWLLNVVTDREGVAGCVLIRAIQPLSGLNCMYEKRPAARTDVELGNGPGKLTQALEIDGNHHKWDLCAHKSSKRSSQDASVSIYFAEGDPVRPEEIMTSSRVGITRAIDRDWRFFVGDNAFVSPGVPSDIAAQKRRKRQSRTRTRGATPFSK